MVVLHEEEGQVAFAQPLQLRVMLVLLLALEHGFLHSFVLDQLQNLGPVVLRLVQVLDVPLVARGLSVVLDAAATAVDSGVEGCIFSGVDKGTFEVEDWLVEDGGMVKQLLALLLALHRFRALQELHG
jgi:hypothetical protein